MTDSDKQDRRVQRTRQLLRAALMELIDEKGYDAVTIRDITERANLGRTTFYLHYDNKDELFLDHHEGFSGMMMINIVDREQLLSDEPQAGYVDFLQQLQDHREMYHAILAAKDADILMKGVSAQLQRNLVKSLKAIFSSPPSMPIDIVTRYVVSAQLSLIHWWMTQHHSYSAYEICRMLQQLRRATLCDVFEVNENDT